MVNNLASCSALAIRGAIACDSYSNQSLLSTRTNEAGNKQITSTNKLTTKQYLIPPPPESTTSGYSAFWTVIFFVPNRVPQAIVNSLIAI
jgi:hypothetical protein